MGVRRCDTCLDRVEENIHRLTPCGYFFVLLFWKMTVKDRLKQAGWVTLVTLILFFCWQVAESQAASIDYDFDDNLGALSNYGFSQSSSGSGSAYTAGTAPVIGTAAIYGDAVSGSLSRRYYRTNIGTSTEGVYRVWFTNTGLSSGTFELGVGITNDTSDNDEIADHHHINVNYSGGTYAFTLGTGPLSACSGGQGDTSGEGTIFFGNSTWNQMEITWDNDTITATLNGTSMTSITCTPGYFASGPLSLAMNFSGSSDTLRVDDMLILTNEDVDPAPGEDTTRIIINEPPPDPGSRTFDVDLSYYLNSSTPDAGEYTHILLQLCALSYTSDPCLKFNFNGTEIDSWENEVISVEAQRDGYHLLMVNFWNGVEETVNCNWYEFWCGEEVPLVGPGSSVRFNVATTSIAADVPAWVEDMDICGGFDGIVDAALCNGLAFLFIPSTESLDRLFSLDDVLATKQPFGFFFLVEQKLTEVVETEGAAGTDLTVDLGDSFMGEINVFSFTGAKGTLQNIGAESEGVTSIMVWFLWLAFAYYCWFRVMHSTTGAQPKQLDLTGNPV